VLANNPEGNMWYEMSEKKDLLFLPLPDDLRQKLVREGEAQLVEIPFRYMRGVGDKPVPTVGTSGEAVYATRPRWPTTMRPRGEMVRVSRRQ
jgi:hypothetical protein